MNKCLAWVECSSRFGLGALFVLAGLLKLEDPQAFADGIHAYRILPETIINPIALGLPVFEVLVGAGLLAGWRLRAMALASAALLLAFSAALVHARIRHLVTDCGCFGRSLAIERALNPLLRDAILLAAAVFLLARRARVPDRGSCRPPGGGPHPGRGGQ